MATTTVEASTLQGSITAQSVSSVPTSIIVDTSSPISSNPSSTSTSTPVSSTFLTTTPQPQTTTGATPVRHDSSLSNGQIIGIVCGAVAAAVVSCAIFAIIFCIRRKRKRNEEEKDWPMDTGDQEHTEPERQSHPSDVFHNATMVGSRPNESVAVPSAEGNRRSYWRKSIKPEEIGVAVSPEIKQESPASTKSSKTWSQILPEKPRYTIWPAPSLINQQLDKISEKPKQTEATTGTLQLPPRVVSSRTGNGLPTDPRARMYALERHRSTGRIPLTPVYDNGNPQEWPRPLNVVPRGLQLQVPSNNKPRDKSSIYSNQNFNAGPPTRAPSFHLPGQPIQQRASSRYSNTSESTDFEIDDYEYDRDSNDEPLEPSTPRPQRSTFQSRPILSALSPVAESPRFSPPRQYRNEDDPFTSPVRKQPNTWIPAPGNADPSRSPRPRPVASQNKERVLASNKPYAQPIVPEQKGAAKDHLIADSQSFLMTNATTPEDEIGGNSSSSASCSQPSLAAALPQSAGQSRTQAPPIPRSQFLSPPEPQQRVGRSGNKEGSRTALRPISPPERMASPSDSLLAKRRGPETASTLLSTGLRLSPELANRPRDRRGPNNRTAPQPSPRLDGGAAIGSIWETIGRGRYEAAARPPMQNHSSSSSADSSRAVVGAPVTPSMIPPKSPFGTKVTPTRRDNGDLFLRVE